MALDSPNLILVAGMHRSGTSLLTRVVSLCGAALPRGIGAPAFDNPTGHWEPLYAREINDAYLSLRQSAWEDVGLAYRNPPAGRAGFGQHVGLVRTLLASIHDFFVRDIPNAPAVVLKEPRISVLLPFWIHAAQQRGFNVKVLHVFRNPADVAASLAARDGMDASRAYMLWQKYNVLAERDARPLPRAFVAYESLLAGGVSEIERCLRTVGLDSRIAFATCRAVEAFISHSLRHHVDVPPSAGRARIRKAEKIHAALRALTQTDGTLDDDFLRDYAADADAVTHARTVRTPRNAAM